MTDQQYLRSEAAADSSQPNPDIWRKEIHSRVARFRTRRGRRIEGAFSMRFPFPPVEQGVSTSEADVQPQSPEHGIPISEIVSATVPIAIAVAVAEPPELTAEPLAVAKPHELTAEATAEAATPELPKAEPQPAIQPRPRPKRKVIAFPRQPGASESVHRLADPVLAEQPRILDVPEELEAFPTTPFLEGLQFESATQASAVPSDHIELPFRAVRISQRIYAALMDCLLVATAAAVFGVIGHKMLPNLVFTKPARLTAALVPVLLWAIYQYLLLIY